MIQKAILIFLAIAVIMVFIIAYSGDYSRDLGNGYVLERTNACCIFIMKNENLAVVDSNDSVGRLIKPQIKKLYTDGTYIVGLKVSNKCCYLDEDEKKHNTPNGYFIINKVNGEVKTGLKKDDLIRYGIKLKKMKEVL